MIHWRRVDPFEGGIRWASINDLLEAQMDLFLFGNAFIDAEGRRVPPRDVLLRPCPSPGCEETLWPREGALHLLSCPSCGPMVNLEDERSDDADPESAPHTALAAERP